MPLTLTPASAVPLHLTPLLPAIGITGNIYDVTQHGALGDGVTDDQPAIQALLDLIPANSIVYFPGDSNCFLSTRPAQSGGVSWHLSCSVDNVAFVGGPGATLTTDKAGTSVFFVGGNGKAGAGMMDWWKTANFYIDYYTYMPGSEGPAVYALTGTFPKGSTTLTLTGGAMTAALAAGLVVGDYIFIRTGQVLPTNNNGNPDGELNKVEAISGDTISLERPTAKPYQQEYYPTAPSPSGGSNFPVTTTTPSAWPAPYGISRVTDRTSKNISFRGLKVIGPSGGPSGDKSDSFVFHSQLDGLVIEDCEIENLGLNRRGVTRGAKYRRNKVTVDWAAHVALIIVAFADIDWEVVDNEVCNWKGGANIHAHEGPARGQIKRNLIMSKRSLAIEAPSISIGARGYDLDVEENVVVNSGNVSAYVIRDCPNGGGTFKNNRAYGTFGTTVLNIDAKSSPGWEIDQGLDGRVQIGGGAVGTVKYLTDNIMFTNAAITGATNATPISITATAHGFVSGDLVTIVQVGGNTAANGIWAVTKVDANTFTLNGSVGNGAYTSGGYASKKWTVTLGVIPQGAKVLQPTISVDTAFNGGSNNTIRIGHDDWQTYISNPVDVSVAEDIEPDRSAGYISTTQTIKAYYQFTGTAPTTGTATVVVPFGFVVAPNAP